MEKILSTKRKVILKDMDVDDMDNAKDLCRFSQEKDGMMTVYNVNKSNTAWIRGGLIGGDFKTEINGSVPDSVIKELSDVEKGELVKLIQDFNSLGK